MFQLIIFLSFSVLCFGQKNCRISIDSKTGDLKEPQPLILNDSYEILSPNIAGILNFSNGQLILLACPGRNNRFNIPLKPQQIIKSYCLQDKRFQVDGMSYSFNYFTCKKAAKSEIRKTGSCLRKFSQVDIGFEVSRKFIPILKICRDDTTDETYYSTSKMSESVGGSQHHNPRPNWITHELFQKSNINDLYKVKHQQQILGMILNSEELANKYLKQSQLNRGHLTARGDFVYGLEQNSTFSFANAAPQWSSFNSGNWKYTEIAIRDFVVENNLKVITYTGVHGHMTLHDVNDEEQPIYLNIDENNIGYIKVPQFFWKIVYDPVERLALAVVGVNNPFSKTITKDMFLCKDISYSPSVRWLTKFWKNRKDIFLGVSYACHYEELKKIVRTIPDLKVKGVLHNYYKRLL